MDVKIKDRNEKIEMLRMALNMAQIGVDYKTTDLINDVIIAVEKHGGKYSLRHGANLYANWISKWDNYDKKNKTKK